MNCGKSSNCVHWLYAVVTGTSTSIDSSTIAIGTSSVAFRPCASSPRAGSAANPLALEAIDQPPGAGQEGGGEVQLHEIARKEGRQTLLERRQEIVVRDVREPREAEEIDDDVPGQHRRDGRGEAAIPAPLGEPARRSGGKDEADDVPAGGAGEVIPAVILLLEDGSARDPGQRVEDETGEAADGAERRAHEEDGEGLSRDRDRIEGDAHLRRERDERGARDDEENVGEEARTRQDGEAESRCIGPHRRSYHFMCREPVPPRSSVGRQLPRLRAAGSARRPARARARGRG